MYKAWRNVSKTHIYGWDKVVPSTLFYYDMKVCDVVREGRACGTSRNSEELWTE